MVRSVHDGDTIRAECGGDSVKVRLYCIDTPELAQRPWGQEPRDALRQLAPRGAAFTLRQYDTERYGRIVGELIRDGLNLNQELVRTGQAAVYPKYCPQTRSDYYEAERKARRDELGIWSKPGKQQEPWMYRNSQH
ncbi:MAG: thermonuclease family protein [Thiotrichales bacterium]